MHKLLIKTHNITGLKYLCYTQREDHCAYTGSGKRWKHHIKQHGYDVTTELVYESESYDNFVKVAREYSALYDVVNDESWANLRIEEGDGGDTVSNKCWITNGVNDVYHLKSEPIPEGWSKGRSKCIFNDVKKQKEFGAKANRNSDKQKEASRKVGLRNVKPITLNGITYPSRKEAMQKLNITKCKLYMMIYDQNRKTQ